MLTRYDEVLNRYHPRTAFLKTLPLGASFLDVGAGDGGMVHFKTWLEPQRPDISFYAYSLEKGEHFDLYDGYEVGRWPAQKPDFRGKLFDAIFTAHFIEHIDDASEAVAWCASRLSEQGRLYIEWPSEKSLSTPTKEELEVQGLKVMIGNYYDDSTHHKNPPTRDSVLKTLEQAGLTIEQCGYVRIPFIESGLPLLKKAAPLSYALQAAYWSATRWCQYIVAGK